MDARRHHDLRAIFDAGVRAALPGPAIARVMRREGPEVVVDGVRHRGERVRVLGAGKAAVGMARAVEAALGGGVSGLVVAPHGVDPRSGAVVVRHGAHPVPDRAGQVAAEALAAEAEACRPGDLVVGVWSGGGSALLALPAPGFTLEDVQRATVDLLRSGRPIHEVNAVRRRIGALAGGGLAQRLGGIDAVHLWISDVEGNDLATIASGPVIFADGREDRAQHVVIADNATAVDAAVAAAVALGWRVRRGPWLVGEAREVGAALPMPGVGEAWIAGGETTVTVRGKGTGGRCQELALAAATAHAGADFALLAAGTDGRDGPTNAAGALADGTTARRARDPVAALADNDSHRVFAALGDLVRTGPTGTNVNDLVVVLGPAEVRGQ